MHRWSHLEAETATRGKATLPFQFTGFTIDSRNVLPGSLFVALTSSTNDGHAYVKTALANGAAAALVSHIPEGIDATNTPLLRVQDSLQALTDLGIFQRARYQGLVIAVTGSVGKTSTKEALAHIFSDLAPTHYTAGNYNNHLGVPITLATMPLDTRTLIIELGMNHAGEISMLTKQARPHIAIITTIEAAHIEFFDSVEAIADAKAEIFEGLEEGGTAILNIDSPYYDRLKPYAAGYRTLSFGEAEAADIRLTGYEEQKGRAQIQATVFGKPITIDSATIGYAHAKNQLAALAAVHAAGSDIDHAVARLGTLNPPIGRGRRHQRALHDLPLLIVDESYNASPVATKAAIRNLSQLGAQLDNCTLAILADMNADMLPEDNQHAHKALKASLVENGIQHVIAIGPKMHQLYQTLPPSMQFAAFPDAPHCAASIIALLEQHPAAYTILIKGSHAMKSWLVLESLLQNNTIARMKEY
jgi:UDP-N-acetylmuramoyl-tripeptide--D-alanyl-D-alanine ligase